jgi:hypothetical protein
MQPTPDTTTPPDTHTLKGDMDALLARANGQSITMQQMIDALQDRGHAVLLILLTAPFAVIPIPGFSTIGGAVIMCIAASLTLGFKPWVPGFIARKEISNERLTKLVHAVDIVFGKIGKMIKPRMQWLVTLPGSHFFLGLSIMAATVALALPIPIPGNNIPPAICILILAFGLLERDGVMVIIGHVYNLLMWIAMFVAVYLFWAVVVTTIMGYWNRVF